MTVNINGLSSSSKRSSLSDCVKSKIQLYACLQEMNSKKEKKTERSWANIYQISKASKRKATTGNISQ